MSYEARDWAMTWRSGLTSTQLFVFLTIADHYNAKAGKAWPSIARIADLTRFSERSVQRAVRDLEGAGLVEVGSAGGKANAYRLPLYDPSAPVDKSDEGRHSDTPKGDTVTGVGVTEHHPRGDRASGEGRHSDTQTGKEPLLNPYSNRYARGSAPKQSKTDRAQAVVELGTRPSRGGRMALEAGSP